MKNLKLIVPVCTQKCSLFAKQVLSSFQLIKLQFVYVSLNAMKHLVENRLKNEFYYTNISSSIKMTEILNTEKTKQIEIKYYSSKVDACP